MKRSLTGIRPSGELHFGNYLGTIKPAIELQKNHECLYFIADLHSLTTNKNPKLIRQYSYDIVATYIALGLDYTSHILWRQSDIPAVTELAWYLSCVTGVGFLEKAHAYKDAASKDVEVNHGVFAYPVLMAADILLFDPDVVPVGKDQKQHVEMARDMAGSFNALFGDVLKLPQPLIREEVMTVPGLDGRKMSKSYDNVIPIFCEEKELKKRILSIPTDSTPMEDSKSMKDSVLGQIFSVTLGKDIFDDIEKKLQGGNYGWGHAKLELFEGLKTLMADKQTQYFSIRKDEIFLNKVLSEGKEKASSIASKVLSRVRMAQGFNG